MATQITATLPTLNFPREVDYPTQENWAAFSAAAEENFGILGGDWSTQMQNWKDQANAMSIELNNNANLAQSISNYQGDWTSKGYTLGQTVSVSGVYYICKLTHTTGQNPTDVSSLYWNLALGNWYGNFGMGTQSFNGFGGSGFKNYIINGNFDVWQRGTNFSFSTFSPSYSADRWSTFSGIQADVSKDTDNTLKLSSSSGGDIPIIQIIETAEVNKMVGKTVTLSAYIKGVISNSAYIGAEFSTITDNNVLGPYNTIGQYYFTIPSDTVYTRFSLTFVIPITAKTLKIVIRTGPSRLPNEYMHIQRVQLEEGSIATPFEHRPYGLELSLCQRYWRQGNDGPSGQGEGGAANFMGAVFSGSEYGVTIPFDTEMRISPTIITTDVYNQNFSEGSISNVSAKGITIRKTANSTANVGRFIVKWTASAEL